jgi:signal peptidase II
MPETSHRGHQEQSSRFITGLSFFTTALSVIALDQVSKVLVRANMTLGQSMPDEGPFRITYITNVGGAFGILGNQGFLILVTTMMGIAAILLYARYPLFNRMLAQIALGLLLGGAVGNLIDRIFQGEVTDFIDVGAWPVFNLADTAITIGIILFLYYLIFPARRQR